MAFEIRAASHPHIHISMPLQLFWKSSLFFLVLCCLDFSVWNQAAVTLCMLKTLERYQKCNYGAPETNIISREIQTSQQEYLKLKARVEALQRSQRNLLGEDLGPLSIKELEQLERQLDASLRQIRSTRTQCMLDQLADLQRREQMLCEANKALKIRMDEGNQANQQQLWDPNAQAVAYCRHQPQPQGDGFFQPIECEPTLQIGYHPDQMAIAAAAPGPSVSSYVPGWLA
nr:PREDICTED: agamous-like MADS-box protein AGL9 homolog isoform X2 [Musa acuminata subsp. malaccensis]XP_018674216.1 PREDICTED: agamous-like MADS-box protein AGL9 homolog isoform X2 [Musa acuminata subsp. malaccensis]